MSLDFRRDAFGLLRTPLVAADEPPEPQARLHRLVVGAGGHRPHRGDLARLPRHIQGTVAVRLEAVRRRRDVRAGSHTVSRRTMFTWTRSAKRIARRSPTGRICASGPKRRSWNRSRSRNSTSNSDAGGTHLRSGVSATVSGVGLGRDPRHPLCRNRPVRPLPGTPYPASNRTGSGRCPVADARSRRPRPGAPCPRT